MFYVSKCINLPNGTLLESVTGIFLTMLVAKNVTVPPDFHKTKGHFHKMYE